MNKAMILDRDGTINVDKNYLYKSEDFEFIPGAPEAIKRFNDMNYLVIVISNQSGIARGYFTEEDLLVLHKYMDEELEKYGAHIDDYYYCPHLPDAPVEKYRIDCNCRKPKTGLLEQAIQKYNIDLANSWVVGDRTRDVDGGVMLGMKGALVLSTNKDSNKESNKVKCYRNLYEFSITI